MIQLHAGFIKVRTKLYGGRRAQGAGLVKKLGQRGSCVPSFFRLDGSVVVSLIKMKKCILQDKNTREHHLCNRFFVFFVFFCVVYIYIPSSL